MYAYVYAHRVWWAWYRIFLSSSNRRLSGNFWRSVIFWLFLVIFHLFSNINRESCCLFFQHMNAFTSDFDNTYIFILSIRGWFTSGNPEEQPIPSILICVGKTHVHAGLRSAPILLCIRMCMNITVIRLSSAYLPRLLIWAAAHCWRNVSFQCDHILCMSSLPFPVFLCWKKVIQLWYLRQCIRDVPLESYTMSIEHVLAALLGCHYNIIYFAFSFTIAQCIFDASHRKKLHMHVG